MKKITKKDQIVLITRVWRDQFNPYHTTVIYLNGVQVHKTVMDWGSTHNEYPGKWLKCNGYFKKPDLDRPLFVLRDSIGFKLIDLTFDVKRKNQL